MRLLFTLLLMPLLVAGCDEAESPMPTFERTASISNARPVQASLSADRTYLSSEEQRVAAEANLLPADAKSLLNQASMQYGEYVWNEDDALSGDMEIWVDVRRQTVSVFRDGHEIGTAIIVYGAPGKESPLGTFRVKRKVADYHSMTYDAPMPHSLFLTDDGVALHGSDVRPRRATRGCIGVPAEFAAKLYAATSVGTPVRIVESTAVTVAGDGAA